jgi:hypothetical protein
MSDKKIPTGVKVLSIIHYIGAGLYALIALMTIVGMGMITLILPMLAGFGFLITILLIGLAVLSFFIAKGLGKGKNWARILVIIFSGLGIILGIIQMIGGDIFNSILTIIVEGIVGGYLLLNKQVKGYFK